MNYQKLDSALAAALHDIQDLEDRCLLVFIHTEPTLNSTAIALLERLGVNSANSGSGIFTATLSANDIALLSNQSWVYYIKHSQKLYPLVR